MTEGRSDSSNALLMAAAAIVLAIAIWALRDLVILLGLSVMLAYVLDPIVTAIERLRLPRGARVPRGAAAAVVTVALLVAVVWGVSLGAPRLVTELGRFVERTPRAVATLLEQARAYAGVHGLTSYVDPAIESVRSNASGLLQQGVVAGTRWLGGLFGNLAQALGLLLLPLLAFYLLAEREAVQASAMQFVPDQARERLETVIGAVDRALRSYVRGLALVCLIMGTLTGSALALLGFPVALLLGVVAGLGEVVPYLGFLVAAVAIVLTGYGVSPLHALLGFLVYAVINNAVGFLITPRVMGRHLKMHPFVITVSVLAGAQLLGPAGVMLAVPAAAVMQSLIKEFAARAGRPDAAA